MSVPFAYENGPGTMSDDPRASVKSADRVLDMFELLARWGEGMSHTALAEALDIPKSSLSQLLKTLTSRGYISFDAGSKTYRLGGRFADLARQTAQLHDLIGLAERVLAEVTERTNESSAFNLLRGDMTEVMATVSSPQRLVSHMRLGDLAPLYATSGGKVILAFLPEAMREEYLGRVVFEPITPNTLTSSADLKRQLETVRREGVAYSFEEFTLGIIGMAMPVLSESGHPLASINIAMPAVRYNSRVREHIIETLGNATAKLTAHIQRSGRL